MNMKTRQSRLEALLRERIVLLDGAMGTMIQGYKLSEAEYRGKRFRDWKGKDLKGSLELLNLTRPQVVEETHAAYLNAGADVVETNTFSGTTIGLNDFLFQGEPTRGRKDQEFFQRVVDDPDLRALVREINLEAARIARRAADRVANETGQQRFVGGSMGPLPVAGSISPDVNDPAFRAVSFGMRENAGISARSRSINLAKLTSMKPKPCSKAVSIYSLSKRFSTHSTEKQRCSLSRMHWKKPDATCH